MPSQRAVLWLWYRGTHFRGWQRQAQGPTVQQAVEAQLRALGIQGGLAAAGRTDRGVHARQQLASLRVPLGRDIEVLGRSLGGAEWGCAAAALAPQGFHAQWTPSTKEYRYRLSTGPPPAGWGAYAWDLLSELRLEGAAIDVEALGDVLVGATGTRDFFAFHAASSIRRLRTLSRVELHRDAPVPGLWELRVQGTGFGRYQVRALVGGAALVASGRLPLEAWAAALEEATAFSGLLAPPQGLVLWAVHSGGLGPFDATGSARLPTGPPFETSP
ncbi:MAG: tRNA pseudouridine(38-40) synthase TruA [Myxococcaceae bacterium]